MDRRRFLLTSSSLIVPTLVSPLGALAATGASMRRSRRAVSVLQSVNGNTTGSNTTFNFSSVSIGTAFSNRLVVVALSAEWGSNNTDRSVSSLTIGGISATICEGVTIRTSGGVGISTLCSAFVPSGSTADISVVFTLSMDKVAYTAYVLENVINSSAFHTNATASTGTNLATTVNCPSGGIIIGSLGTNRNSMTTTWTGLNEVDDFTYNSGNEGHSTAALSVSDYTAALNTSVVITGTDATPRAQLVVASFR
jgi:hypothetical protein